jgi:hypothetical protein
MLMDIRGARKSYVPSRSLLLIIAACAVLLIPALWVLRQSHLAEQERQRARAAERAARLAAEAAAADERARLQAEKKAARAKGDDRIRQLIEEITVLSREQDRLRMEISNAQKMLKKGSGPGRVDAP